MTVKFMAIKFQHCKDTNKRANKQPNCIKFILMHARCLFTASESIFEIHLKDSGEDAYAFLKFRTKTHNSFLKKRKHRKMFGY